MRKFHFVFILSLIVSCSSLHKSTATKLPLWMKGKFTDDYGINYNVSDTLFMQQPDARYHIIRWNKEEQYLLVKNDEKNPSEKGLYSRIDYMQFTGMEPFTWGFCLTVYDAKDTASALKAPPADRNAPKKGCNGYPFSRMKAIPK